MIMILIGPPGAGKGTQASRIEEFLSIGNLSTGALLRDAIASNSKLGKQAKALVEAGNFVPDDVIIGLVSARIEEPDCENGFILDGFPRTSGQAEALDRLLEKRGKKVDVVVEIKTEDDVVVERINGRFACKTCGEGYHKAFKVPAEDGVCDNCGGTEFEQRADDSEEKIRTRLALYHEQTAPILPYYESRGILRSVDGTKDLDDVTEQLKEVLAAVN
ncbi:MAG: adenylate kinase [Alphaproteobacteria bacterium]|nr:adenylate kinase [Alphaproteobacteria bacterium]